MKTKIVLVLLVVSLTMSCKQKSKEAATSVVTYEETSPNSVDAIVVKEYFVFDKLVSYYVLVNEKGESRWDLIKLAAQEITAFAFENNEQVTKVYVHFFDEEKIMPKSLTSAKQVEEYIMNALVFSYVTENSFIAMCEANRKGYSPNKVEVAKYPIRQLLNMSGDSDLEYY